MQSAALIGAKERAERLKASIRACFAEKHEAARKAKSMSLLDPDFDAQEAELQIRKQYQAATRIRFLSSELRKLKEEIVGMEANPRNEFMPLFLGAVQEAAYMQSLARGALLAGSSVGAFGAEAVRLKKRL